MTTRLTRTPSPPPGTTASGARPPRRAASAWGGSLGLLFVAVWALHGAQLSRLGDLDVRGVQVLAGVLRPDLSAPVLAEVAKAAAATVQIAIAGLLLSVLAAAPLALLMAGSSRAAPLARTAARMLAALLRGIPELVYALVFVSIVGLGPVAGTCAVAVHGAGLLAKLWAEQLEAVDDRPVTAARLSGAGRGAVVTLAVLPQARPGLLSLLLYQLECNIRTATVLGIVGAGGLGQAIDLSLRLFDYGRLGTLVATVLVLVLGVDALSRRRRARWGADARPETGT